MEGLFGADLDDDLFENEKKSKSAKESVPWTPLKCEPEWFYDELSSQSTDCDANSDHSMVSVKHYQAHHLFYKCKFAEAAESYQSLLSLIPPTNLQMRREITDALTRCYLKAKKYEEALTSSQELVKTCKNQWQRAAWHSLVAEIFRCTSNRSKELAHLQSAIMVHQLNADLWLKAAECYHTSSSREDMYQGCLQLSQTTDSTWHAAASLIRAHVILKSVIKACGEETFGRKRCRNLLEKMEPLIYSLPLGFVAKAVQALSRDVYNVDQRESSEFQDLGSSKHRAAQNEEDEDEVDNLEMIKQKFESHWFSFLSSIVADDLESPSKYKES